MMQLVRFKTPPKKRTFFISTDYLFITEVICKESGNETKERKDGLGSGTNKLKSGKKKKRGKMLNAPKCDGWKTQQGA